jgi:predicted DNA-binding protein with PD1-like motif
MRYELIEQHPKTYAVVFETGKELASGLKEFAQAQELTSSSFKAIGAFSSVRLAWFDWEKKEYRPSVVFNEQVELVSLIGDVALKDGEPEVHAHVVVARADGSAYGGHLLEAYVRPTCEVILTESAPNLHKEIDPESGLALIKL